jgi:hypothetical protein
MALRHHETGDVAGTDPNHRRLLRGGAFNNNDNVRCAYRNHNEPDNRNNDIGFRVVLSTLSDSRTARRGSAPLRDEENGGIRSWPRPPTRPGQIAAGPPPGLALGRRLSLAKRTA